MLAAIATYFLRFDPRLAPHQLLYSIPYSLNERTRKIVLACAVVVQGTVGALAVGLGKWTLIEWFSYIFSSGLLAGFIWVYQINQRHALIGATGIIAFLAFYTQKIFYHISHQEHQGNTLVLSIWVGVLEGWAMVWMLYTLGQWVTYEFKRLSDRIQTAVFFLLSLLVVVGLVLVNVRVVGKVDVVMGVAAGGMFTIGLFGWSWRTRLKAEEAAADVDFELK